jgi:hypothetical protein
MFNTQILLKKLQKYKQKLMMNNISQENHMIYSSKIISYNNKLKSIMTGGTNELFDKLLSSIPGSNDGYSIVNKKTLDALSIVIDLKTIANKNDKIENAIITASYAVNSGISLCQIYASVKESTRITKNDEEKILHNAVNAYNEYLELESIRNRVIEYAKTVNVNKNEENKNNEDIIKLRDEARKLQDSINSRYLLINAIIKNIKVEKTHEDIIDNKLLVLNKMNPHISHVKKEANRLLNLFNKQKTENEMKDEYPISILTDEINFAYKQINDYINTFDLIRTSCNYIKQVLNIHYEYINKNKTLQNLNLIDVTLNRIIELINQSIKNIINGDEYLEKNISLMRQCLTLHEGIISLNNVNNEIEELKQTNVIDIDNANNLVNICMELISTLDSKYDESFQQQFKEFYDLIKTEVARNAEEIKKPIPEPPPLGPPPIAPPIAPPPPPLGPPPIAPPLGSKLEQEKIKEPPLKRPKESCKDKTTIDDLAKCIMNETEISKRLLTVTDISKEAEKYVVLDPATFKNISKIVQCEADNLGLEIININVGGTGFGYPIRALYNNQTFWIKILLEPPKQELKKIKPYQRSTAEYDLFERLDNIIKQNNNFEDFSYIVGWYLRGECEKPINIKFKIQNNLYNINEFAETYCKYALEDQVSKDIAEIQKKKEQTTKTVLLDMRIPKTDYGKIISINLSKLDEKELQKLVKEFNKISALTRPITKKEDFSDLKIQNKIISVVKDENKIKKQNEDDEKKEEDINYPLISNVIFVQNNEPNENDQSLIKFYVNSSGGILKVFDEQFNEKMLNTIYLYQIKSGTASTINTKKFRFCTEDFLIWNKDYKIKILFLEDLNKGNWCSYLSNYSNKNKNYEIQFFKSLIWKILDQLSILSRYSIYHGDTHINNILFTEINTQLVPKLIDFDKWVDIEYQYKNVLNERMTILNSSDSFLKSFEEAEQNIYGIINNKPIDEAKKLQSINELKKIITKYVDNLNDVYDYIMEKSIPFIKDDDYGTISNFIQELDNFINKDDDNIIEILANDYKTFVQTNAYKITSIWKKANNWKKHYKNTLFNTTKILNGTAYGDIIMFLGTLFASMNKARQTLFKTEQITQYKQKYNIILDQIDLNGPRAFTNEQTCFNITPGMIAQDISNMHTKWLNISNDFKKHSDYLEKLLTVAVFIGSYEENLLIDQNKMDKFIEIYNGLYKENIKNIIIPNAKKYDYNTFEQLSNKLGLGLNQT